MAAEPALRLSDWLNRHPFGHYLKQLEDDFLADKLARIPLPTVLQLGMSQWAWRHSFPRGVQWLQQAIPDDATSGTHYDVAALPDALPWQSQSINTVICLHGFDRMAQLAPTLQEIHRVLPPGGQVVVTGLNAIGYWRLFYRSLLRSGSLQLHTATALTASFRQYGMILSEGCFMGYGFPGCHYPCTAAHKPAIEYMGNRWWPHLAALYGLVFTKQTVPLTPVNALKPAFQQADVLGLRAAQRNLK